MVLKRTLKLFTAVVLKRTDWRLGRCSTVVSTDCCEVVVVGGEAAGAVVSAGENGCGVSICWLVKTAVVCQSVGSSSKTKDFRRSMKVLTNCVVFFRQ